MHFVNSEKPQSFTFVGNITAENNLADYVKLGIRYILGKTALDIHGNKVETLHMKPLFISDQDLKKYDDYMMQKT